MKIIGLFKVLLVTLLVCGLTPVTAKKSKKAKKDKQEKEAEEKIVVLPPIDKDAQAPKGVDKKLMSDDPDYGYTDQKPIRVGSKEEFGGPAAEQAYLNLLLDAQGNKVKYKRLFSGGNDPEGTILDCYEVTVSSGTKVRLWISMYAPKNKPSKQPAPVGFYKAKK